MCRHIYDWNIVNCDVKQPFTHSLFSPSAHLCAIYMPSHVWLKYCWFWGEVNWLLNVTINNISVIYVTAHWCAGGLKKLDLRSGSQRHRHLVGFLNVPVQAPTRDQPFHTVISTHHPNKSPFTTRWEYGGHILGYPPPPALRGMFWDFKATEGDRRLWNWFDDIGSGHFVVATLIVHQCFIILWIYSPPCGRRGFKMRIRSQYPQRVIKGD